jgi:HEAT repeat protein
MSDKEWDGLIHMLREIDEADSAAAATRLHNVATAQDLARLMELLKDDDPFVREAAAWPISELAGPSVLGELLVAYQRGLDAGLDNDGFATALIGLVEMNKDASREALRRLADDADPAIRESVTWLLEFCPPQRDSQ